MGLFKKKRDPISDQERALSKQIAALESEIRRLSAGGTATPPPEPDPAGPKAKNGSAVPAVNASASPRLRSTTLPQGPTPLPARNKASSEPVFVPMEQASLDAPDRAGNGHFNDLGVRKYDLAAAWNRLKNHFRGPTTSNPKLVNYLAAGSIQGLRPLRYEKRVARNRFLLLVSFLVLFLWGIIYVFFVRR